MTDRFCGFGNGSELKAVEIIFSAVFVFVIKIVVNLKKRYN